MTNLMIGLLEQCNIRKMNFCNNKNMQVLGGKEQAYTLLFKCYNVHVSRQIMWAIICKSALTKMSFEPVFSLNNAENIRKIIENQIEASVYRA